MPSELTVALALIERDGRFLVAQRKPNDSFGGLWEFPGGKIQPGETMQEGLAREILEELGVRIEVGPKRLEIRHRYPGRSLRLHCFDCRWVSGEPQAIECTTWRWVKPGELGSLRFPPASGPILQQIAGSR